MAGSYRAQRNKQAAQPPPDVAKLRARVIRKLLAIVEGDERPEAIVQASRVLLDLPAERERSAEGAQVSSDEDRRKSAARLVAEAFREIAQLPPPDPVKIWATPPAPLIEATPVGAAAEGNGENAEAAVPVKIAHGTRPIPFAQRYGRRLNKHY